jgi:hypothetical protein
VSILELPYTATLEELASWYAEHFAEIKQLRSFLYVTSQRLTEYVREGGPIRTPVGLLEILPKGWIWDAEMIREFMPALLVSGSVTFSSDRQEQVERILSIVLEEFSDVAYELKWTVDKYAAAAVIKAGGEAGAKMTAARKPDGALGVRDA